MTAFDGAFSGDGSVTFAMRRLNAPPCAMACARRQARVEQEENRDSVWLSLLDHEWPVAGAAMRRWLDADNFDHALGNLPVPKAAHKFF